MAISKSKLMIGGNKIPKGKVSMPKLGASTSSSKSPLLKGVKQRKGKGSQQVFDGAVPSFGQTGLTGET
jgi:hypothetical protein